MTITVLKTMFCRKESMLITKYSITPPGLDQKSGSWNSRDLLLIKEKKWDFAHFLESSGFQGVRFLRVMYKYTAWLPEIKRTILKLKYTNTSVSFKQFVIETTK